MQDEAAAAAAPQQPIRTVHCCDALEWLQQQPGVMQGCSFITSLPDISELQGQGLSLEQYKVWFVRAAQLVLGCCPDDGVAIFFQTDIKVEGSVLNKAYLVQRAAEETGHALLWHKVVCRVPPGTISYSRPSYHHMLCFSKGVRPAVVASTADVLHTAGDTTWTRGMGTAACAAACRFVLAQTGTRTVVDPFCGHGTVLAVANELGLGAIGVEIGRKRAKQAQRLSAAGLVLNKGSRWCRDGQGPATGEQHGAEQQRQDQQGSNGSSSSSGASGSCQQQEAQAGSPCVMPGQQQPPPQQQQQQGQSSKAPAAAQAAGVGAM